MTILSRITSRLPVPTAVAWKYLVHLCDCDKWMEERDLIGTALLLENGTYAGFQFGPVEVGMDPIVCLVHTMDPPGSIHFQATEPSSATVPANARAYFPFRSMKQSMIFNHIPDGCEVVHTIEYEPRGALGWLTCRALLIPLAKRSVVQSHHRLAAFLAHQNVVA